MPLIQFVMVLITVGVLLWLVNRFVPMASSIKSILNAVVVIGVVLVAAECFWIHGLHLRSPRGQVTIDRQMGRVGRHVGRGGHLRLIGNLRARELEKELPTSRSSSFKLRVSGTALETIFRLGCRVGRACCQHRSQRGSRPRSPAGPQVYAPRLPPKMRRHKPAA